MMLAYRGSCSGADVAGWSYLTSLASLQSSPMYWKIQLVHRMYAKIKTLTTPTKKRHYFKPITPRKMHYLS